MKVAIFYTAAEKQLTDTIQSIIMKQNCDVVVHQTNEIWNAALYKSPSQLLQGITHVLFIYTKEPIKDPVFVFFSGMAIGKNIPIIIIEQNIPVLLPFNSKKHAVILKKSEFENYFVNEQKAFLKQESKRAAKDELLKRGYPCFDANFIGAVIDGNYDIVTLFLRAGFNPSLKDSRGTPVLSLAVRESHYETAALLLAHGAKVNLCAEDRAYSPLMEASQRGDLKTAKLLLSRDADTNIQSKDGQTALILAVGRQDVPMVKLLTEHHADWNIADSMGMSARGYAELFHNPHILAYVQ